MSGGLSTKQMEAVRILARHRDRPMTGKPTAENAVNYHTAWSLQDAGLADCGWWNGAERVCLTPPAKQLLLAPYPRKEIKTP